VAAFLTKSVVVLPVQFHSVLSRSKAPLLLIALAVVIAIIGFVLHAIPQPLSYHDFADQRPCRPGPPREL